MTEQSPSAPVDLASCLPDTRLNAPELALVLDVSPRTIRRMVERLEIPPGISLGGKKVWFAGKVRDYLKARADSVAQRSQRNRWVSRELPPE